MSYARLHGKYIGVDPAKPETVYVDRAAGGGWEDLSLTPQDGGVVATFVAANRVLSIQPDGSLQTRPAGTAGGWELLTVVAAADGTTLLCRIDGGSVVNVPLTLEGHEDSGQPTAGAEHGFLHVQGTRFATDDGADWVFAGYTNHTLISSIANGEDVLPRLQEARAYGANTIITIGCHLSDWKRANGFYYDPRRGDHRDILARLFDVCASAGVRVAFAALADVQGLSTDEQRAIWHAAGDVAAGRWNVLLRIGNEAGANGWDPDRFDRRGDLGGVLQSKGSVGADTQPSLSPWDFTEYESRRDLPKALLDANCLEQAYGGWDANPKGIAGPIINIEPAYFNDTETDWCGDRGRWTDPGLAYRLGAQIGLESAGGGFGASDGLVCRPLQPLAAECAKSFYRGLRAGFAR